MSKDDIFERVFSLSKHNTNVRQEVSAGFTTFLTMSYILLVNPQLLSTAGIPRGDVVIATAAGSAIASLVQGFVGNLPFGLAPGTGLSAYLAYGLVKGSSAMSWEAALTCCWWAGIIMGVFAVTGISTILMGIIPSSVKMATVVGMGLLITLIGMQSIKLVVPCEGTLVQLGDLTDYNIWLAFGGLILVTSLTFHQVRGGILIGIIVITVISWWIEEDWPRQIVMFPTMEIASKVQPGHWENSMIPGVLAFLFVGIFDVSGVIFGLSKLADRMEPDGEVPGSLWTFLGASLGTVIAAMLGCSPIIVHVESAAGIQSGGRTGLVAVTVGILFFLAIFFAPLLGAVPAVATAPVLILVGAMMIEQATNINWKEMDQAIPAFLTLVTMPFTFSIPNGILFGLVSSFCLYITTGKCFVHMRKVCSSKTGTGEEAVPLLQEQDRELSSMAPPSRGASFMAIMTGKRRPAHDAVCTVANGILAFSFVLAPLPPPPIPPPLPSPLTPFFLLVLRWRFIGASSSHP
jgi:AGZA family xanthine/uracil permease-like MFS transporter